MRNIRADSYIVCFKLRLSVISNLMQDLRQIGKDTDGGVSMFGNDRDL